MLKTLARFALGSAFIGSALFYYLETQNELSTLKMAMPLLAKEIEEIGAHNQRLRFEVECFENPLHLMQLLDQPQFSHMRFPLETEVLAIAPKKSEPVNPSSNRWEFPIALGAK